MLLKVSLRISMFNHALMLMLCSLLLLANSQLHSQCVLVVPKRPCTHETLATIDFALYVINTGGVISSDHYHGGIGTGDVGDVEIGALRDARRSADSSGNIAAGALLVAANGLFFNCMEVFGTLGVWL